MKKFAIIILTILVIPLACRYKEGPEISFRSVKKRLEGTWQITSYTSNGVDSLKIINDSCGCDMVIDFPQDWYNINVYFIAGGQQKAGGQFQLLDHKKIMYMMLNGTTFKSLGPIGGGGHQNWEILKLEIKELKISTTFNGRNYLISFNKISQ